jgi:hypothetical protein
MTERLRRRNKGSKKQKNHIFNTPIIKLDETQVCQIEIKCGKEFFPSSSSFQILMINHNRQ